MSWIPSLYHLTRDPVRLVQLFVLCRQTGILLSSVVIARSLSMDEVGMVEMLFLCGYFMTFFWSEALLKGFLSHSKYKEDKSTATTFLWFYFLAALVAMAFLMVGQRVLLPLFVNRTSLEGLEIFVLYQALIVPVWAAPFIGLLKGQDPVLLSLYVLIGPSFASWVGGMSMPGMQGILIGLLSYALVGFLWVLTNTSFVRNLRLKEMLVSVWPATWPLVLYALSAGIARSFDAWLVARYFDESSFAIFRYGAREFPLVLAFAAGLSTIMIPKLKSNEAIRELKWRSKRLMHLSYPVVGLLMIVSPILFVFFFGEGFRSSAIIFNIYLLLTLTQLIFPQSILTARGDARILWYISLAELTINVMASLLLLPYLGLAGIALGTFIAFAFEKIVLMVIVRRRYGIPGGDIIHLRTWAGYIAFLSLCFMASVWIFGI